MTQLEALIYACEVYGGDTGMSKVKRVLEVDGDRIDNIFSIEVVDGFDPMTFEVVFKGNPRKDGQFYVRAEHLVFEQIEDIGVVVRNIHAFVHNAEIDKRTNRYSIRRNQIYLDFKLQK